MDGRYLFKFDQTGGIHGYTLVVTGIIDHFYSSGRGVVNLAKYHDGKPDTIPTQISNGTQGIHIFVTTNIIVKKGLVSQKRKARINPLNLSQLVLLTFFQYQLHTTMMGKHGAIE